MKVVLDTNTVISAIFWHGSPRDVLDLARSGNITIFTSPVLLSELYDVLGREKFAIYLKKAGVTIEALLKGYEALARTVTPNDVEPVILADPDDDHVLACAITARAEIITSGDKHLLGLKEYQGIRIMTASQFLEQR